MFRTLRPTLEPRTQILATLPHGRFERDTFRDAISAGLGEDRLVADMLD
jgi:hypothetical protein